MDEIRHVVFDKAPPVKPDRNLRSTWVKMRAIRKTEGWRGLVRIYGWKLIVLVFTYYIIRDVTLYLLIPWLLARGLFEAKH